VVAQTPTGPVDPVQAVAAKPGPNEWQAFLAQSQAQQAQRMAPSDLAYGAKTGLVIPDFNAAVSGGRPVQQQQQQISMSPLRAMKGWS
jgi:hypothetical protein